MKNERFNQPPRARRRPGVRCDNLVLVPGNVLAHMEQWQAMANTLPRGEVLIMLPEPGSALGPVLTTVTRYFEAAGRPVLTLSVRHFL